MEKLHKGAAKTQRTGSVSFSVLWDDLRVFLSCARSASFRAAGRELKLDATTVVRRVERLEKALETQLFNRLSEGVRLTEEGQRVMREALVMEQAALNIARLSQLKTGSLRGLVKVAITEGLGTYWVLPRLLEFQKMNRLLTIDMQCTMTPTDVGRLEADISIQFTRAERLDLIAVRLGYLHVYPFVSKSYAKHFGIPRNKNDLAHHRIVHQVGPLVDESANELGLESIEGIIGFRSNGSTAVLYAVERDAGIGFLPSYSSTLAGDLLPVDIDVRRRLEIWMTYHPNLKRSARHMAVVEWLRQIFDSRRFPCFLEEFIHPRELSVLMAESARINDITGYAAPTPMTEIEAAESATAGLRSREFQS